MFNLFGDVVESIPLSINPAKLNNIYKLSKVDVGYVVSYYRISSRRVSNTNPLVKFIKTLDIDIFLGVDEYIYKVKTTMYKYMSNHDIVSVYGKNNTMYDNIIKDNHVFVVDNVLDIDYHTMSKETVVMKLIKYTGVSLSMNHPMLLTEDLDTSIIYLDVVGMMIKYKLWVTHQYKLGLSTDTSHFIFYMLSDLIPQMYDFGILNILTTGVSENPPTKVQGLAVTEVSSNVVNALENIRDDIGGVSRRIESILSSIPLPFTPIGVNPLHVEKGYRNSNNKWVEYYAYGTMILSIIKLGNSRTVRVNYNILHQLVKDYKRMMNLSLSGKFSNSYIYTMIVDEMSITYKEIEELL